MSGDDDRRASGTLTVRRAPWLAGAALLVVYLFTLAPGVTFWDAGELIAAAHGFGIPHPPGTPLFIALGRAWTMLFGDVLGVARAMNLMSAVCSAAACALAAWMIAHRTEASDAEASPTIWGAVTVALCAGLTATVWSNATETEVYAVALLHAAAMMSAGLRAGDESNDGWLVCTAYLIALAPAAHLGVLVAAPAAIALASQRADRRWDVERVLLLSGVMVSAAGVGRMSVLLAASGALVSVASLAMRSGAAGTVRRNRLLSILTAEVIAASALLIMLVRAQHDPMVNQGNPDTLRALADVVARRQYDVASIWPRRAPIWLQLANIVQYADWQFALSWGRGVFTTSARIAVTVAYLALGVVGWRALRRDSPRLAIALAILIVSGSIGVCAYLNLQAGASLGYGIVPGDSHEARERDYFFVLGMWGWALCAGYGAVAVLRSRRLPLALSLIAVAVPLAANWRASDRAHGVRATAARDVAIALLSSAPPNAVLFLAGDNDSYPLWYLQQVEGMRRDVAPVTLPLLPADWYAAEIARRTQLQWPSRAYVQGAKWRHEEVAAGIARAARASGRPVAVSPQLSARDRAFLGTSWAMSGIVYVDSNSGAGPSPSLGVTRRSLEETHTHPDDVSAAMLRLLDCSRVLAPSTGSRGLRDSLEVRCNLR